MPKRTVATTGSTFFVSYLPIHATLPDVAAGCCSVTKDNMARARLTPHTDTRARRCHPRRSTNPNELSDRCFRLSIREVPDPITRADLLDTSTYCSGLRTALLLSSWVGRGCPSPPLFDAGGYQPPRIGGIPNSGEMSVRLTLVSCAHRCTSRPGQSETRFSDVVCLCVASSRSQATAARIAITVPCAATTSR